MNSKACHQNRLPELEPLVDSMYGSFDMATVVDDHDLRIKLTQLLSRLLQSFEMERLRWLNQSILLPNLFPGATHTRKAHALGCWIVGCFALHDVRIFPNKKGISLLNWLRDIDKLDEFMSSLLLHDIGHPPFSHALEFEENIRPKLSHEHISASLICGQPVEGDIQSGVNWYKVLKHIRATSLADYYRDDPDQYAEQWIRFLAQSELVHDVLYDHFNKNEEKLRHIKDIILGLETNNRENRKKEEYQQLKALHNVVDGEIDLDRIDHVLRDSYHIGIRFADYNVRDLLQNLEIIMPGSNIYPGGGQNKDEPVLAIKKEGVTYIIYLIVARELLGIQALWYPKNLFYMGALSQATNLVTKVDPHLELTLPFLTDQSLLQTFRNPFFQPLGTKGYELTVRGSIDFNEYELIWPDESQQSPDIADIAVKNIETIYAEIEKANLDMLQPSVSLKQKPAFIVFSNFKAQGQPSMNSKQNKWLKIWVDRGAGKSAQKRIVPLIEHEGLQSLLRWVEDNRRRKSNMLWLWAAKDMNDKKIKKNIIRMVKKLCQPSTPTS
jgi:HD superfamily phosphohydrolase